MRKLAVIALALCSLTIGCSREDTQSAKVWPRTIEPRLSVPTAWASCRKTLRPGHVVEEAQCSAETAGAETTPSKEPCDDILTHADALRVLTAQPACTDAAIAALERFTRTDKSALGDVAAAYYVRAQREDRPADLVRAYDAAEQAVAATPRSPAALFNRALIREALGFPAAAMASWDEVRRLDAPAWAAEAREHRTRLARTRPDTAAAQWQVSRERLPAALDARNRAEVARLIAASPAAAERYLEEELLPRWAESPSPETREAAEIFADQWTRVTHDRFALDVVNAIDVTPSLNELRQGQLAFRDARLAEHAIEPAKAAASYEAAAQALARGGSPLHFLAGIGRAIAMSFEPGDAPLRAAAMFDRAETAARNADWPSVLARVAASRAYVLEFQGRYVEALSAFDEAQAQYARIGDAESIAAIRGNRSTVLGAVGQPERAWAEAWQAMRAIPRIVELQSRHRVLGETAEAALALGQPRLALLYQDAALRLIRADLGSTPPENLRRIGKLQKNLAVALRHRAAIELRLQNYGRATIDLAEAGRVGQDPDTDIRRLVNARIEEVRAQALLHSDVKRAIAAFTRAVNLAAVDDYPTFRGALFAQRADAWRRAGHRANAEADLRSALGELRSEEKLVLAHRQRGSGEEIWGSYFSRSQETYRRLIRQLLDERRTSEAFVYAEEARAFEPLDLVRRLGTLPAAFRHIEPDGETLDVARVRAQLPRGTFILEYCVLDDRTYVWIVSRDAFTVLTLNVPRAKIDRWTAALQHAARTRDAKAFGAGLFAPYDELLAPVLAAMPAATKPERLVFVPDGAMHGLPFAALQDPVTRRHLVEDTPVEIAASTALYVFSLLQDQALAPPQHPSAFLVGDPAFDTRLPLATDLKRLPHARSEVVRVAGLYAPYAETRTDAAASVPAFLSGARAHTIVHVAAHALVNAQAPSRSLLLLAPSPANSGALDAEELLTQLKLDRTKLVVLSTCSSAGGLPVGPEGVAPLVRPLIAAGVPAVIGSLWDVEDATAEELMVSFHRHYRQGSDAAVAMQSAQLDLLRNKNPGLRSVFAWAPFQVIGHASSPYGTTRHN